MAAGTALVSVIGGVDLKFDAFERRGWAGRAGAYERGYARLTAHATAPLLTAVGAAPGRRVLDVGTGTGFAAREAMMRGARVMAIDADLEMVMLAAKNVPGLEVVQAILPQLPFPDDQFDGAVGNFVINHTAEPATALTGLLRVLRPGGRLALTWWHYPAMRANAVFADAVAEVGVPWPDDVPVQPFLAYATADAFARLLIEVGFVGIAVEALAWSHSVDPDTWWTDVLTGTPLNSAVILRQNTKTIAKIKEAYDRLVAVYAAGDGRVNLPAGALLAMATKPIKAALA